MRALFGVFSLLIQIFFTLKKRKKEKNGPEGLDLGQSQFSEFVRKFCFFLAFSD